MFEKQNSVSQSLEKVADAFRLPRSRNGKKRGALLRTKDIWRALSSVSSSSPHTPILRRLHD